MYKKDELEKEFANVANTLIGNFRGLPAIARPMIIRMMIGLLEKELPQAEKDFQQAIADMMVDAVSPKIDPNLN